MWIAAPAGSGKTVAAETLAKARGGPCLWFQLDARDADPASFFFHLRAAAARLVPRKRETLPLLTPAYALSLEAYARDFLEELGNRLRPGTLFVLDDFQELPEDAPLQQLLPRALASLPASVRVVVTSRAAPPAAFARLLTHGSMTTVGERDLALTADETRALARVQNAPELDAKAAAALRARTGGWFAGTILLLAPGAGDAHDAGGDASAREVLFDYFTAEIFDRAPPTIRRFLLETALLPHLSVAAAVLLTGDDHAEDILSELVRRNYFTVRRARSAPTYEYHPLFRAFLLSRARRAFPRERWSELLSRAVGALLGDGAIEDAAALMIEAGDHARLARLVVERAPALARDGRLAAIVPWIRVLPAELRQSDPWVSFWLGVCRTRTARVEARTDLERAYEQFKAAGDAAGQYVAWAAIVRTHVVVWDRFDALDRWIGEFDELRRRYPEFPSVDVEAQVARGITSALMWRRTGHPDVERWAERCVALLRAELPPEMKIELAMVASFYLHWFKGDVAAQGRILDATRPLLEAPGTPPVVALQWQINEASYRSRLGERDACYAAVTSAFATIAASGLAAARVTVSLQAVYGALASGDLASARRWHDDAAGDVSREDVAGAVYHDLVGVWISLCTGELARAAERISGWRERADASGVDFGRAWADHTAAHVLVEEGRHDEALERLEASLAWARESRVPLVEHHCALSIAYALLSAGREADAAEALRPAMALGREHGFVVHPWIGWRHDVMSRLCALALEHGIEVDHVRAQIQASRLQPPPAAPGEWPFPIRIRTLGAFEVWRDEQRVPSDGRANRKPLELLQAIVALGATDVREEALAEALWPDAEGDAAHHALETNLYRLRKLVGPDAVVQRGGRISLDPAICWIDAVAARRSAARICGWLEPARRAPREPGAPPRAAALAREVERLTRVCRGSFLADTATDVAWAAPARERLRRDLARVVAALDAHGVECERLRADAGEPGATRAANERIGGRATAPERSPVRR